MFEALLNEASVWEYLKSTPLPIAVYGTGNGADRVFSEFERLNISVSAVVASDGFVRSRTFHGFPVQSVSSLEGDWVIALAFASPLTGVIDNVKALMKNHKVVMPSVPVYGENIFNKDFLKAHIDEIEKAYNLLADEKSKEVFYNIIRFQITGDIKLCFDCETYKNEAYALLDLGENESFLDLGAYRGDTVDEFLHYTKGYERILALEPDKKTYKKLEAHCKALKNCITLNRAVWSESISLYFDGNRGRGGNAGKKGEEIRSITVDEITEKYGKFTFMNIDVEGAEGEMLTGAEVTLKEHKPKLCMAVYHKSEDIFTLINRVNKLNLCYKIYLRHHPHISFWDTNIYCI